MSRQFALYRALFAQGRGTAAFGVLAVTGAILTAITGDADLRSTHELLSAFAVACTLGFAARRMPALAIWAGQLGIPSHREKMRGGQLLLLAISLTFAIALELQFARDWRALVVPFGVAATLVSFTSLPVFSVTLIATLFIGNSISQEHLLLLFEPIGASVSLGICMPVLYQWGRHVWQLHDRAAVASQSLADAAHEETHAGKLDEAHAILTSDLRPALEVEPAGRVSARRFWLGMGYDPVSSWKVTAYSTLFGVLAFTAAHFLFSARFDWLAYLILSGFTAFALLGRINSMHEAWLRTPHEQSVLMLSPRWPQGTRLKVELLRSLWSGFPGYAAFWTALSAFGVALGWIDSRMALTVGVVLLILTKAVLVLMMHYFAQLRARNTSPFALCYAVLQILGTVTLVAGWAEGSPRAVLIGFAIILVPALPTIYLFSTRRLQFPVRREGAPIRS